MISGGMIMRETVVEASLKLKNLKDFQRRKQNKETRIVSKVFNLFSTNFLLIPVFHSWLLQTDMHVVVGEHCGAG